MRKSFFSGSYTLNVIFQDADLLHPCMFATSTSVFILPMIGDTRKTMDMMHVILQQHPYSGIVALNLNDSQDATIIDDTQSFLAFIQVLSL